MKRNLAAAGAAAALALTAFAPAASAQEDNTGFLDHIGLVNGGIAEADCNTLDFALTNLDLVDDDTTRGELAADLRNRLGGEIAFQLLGSGTINAVADRALECEIVDEDPQTGLPAGSSELLDMVTVLSSGR